MLVSLPGIGACKTARGRWSGYDMRPFCVGGEGANNVDNYRTTLMKKTKARGLWRVINPPVVLEKAKGRWKRFAKGVETTRRAELLREGAKKEGAGS